MNAPTYWDLTEAERAALTRDDVEKYVDFELMSKGVLKAKPLVLLAVPEVKLETSRFYVVQEGAYEYPSIAFRTEDDARAFLTLQPVKVERDFSTEASWAKSSAGTEIKSIELATEDSVTAAKARLKEASAAKAENDRRRQEHVEQARKVEQALRGLWEDWHECTAKDAQMRKIAETFAEYTTMTKDPALAASFLRKVFTPAEIAEAETWTSTRMTFAEEARPDAAAE
jgi:hypothetical protein